MAKMDRIDFKNDEEPRIVFGNVVTKTPKVLIVDVEYPEENAGHQIYAMRNVDNITHGVYVPTAYRKKKSPKAKTKRKTKGCGCK